MHTTTGAPTELTATDSVTGSTPPDSRKIRFVRSRGEEPELQPTFAQIILPLAGPPDPQPAFTAGDGRENTRLQQVECLREQGRLDQTVLARLRAAEEAMPGPGDLFLDFLIVRELGRGGFGRVFLARQTALAGRPVALKISADLSEEMQALAQLQHTNIMPVYSVHRADRLQAVAMPYFGGTTMADICESVRNRGALPQSGRHVVSTLESRRVFGARTVPKAAVPSGGGSIDAIRFPKPTALLDEIGSLTYVEAIVLLGQRIAEGLAHAHERGIIHRDLKPANILLTDDGQPMILDFNLAEDTKSPVRDAVRGGTLPYMSPEQLVAFTGESVAIDARTDIYSLGLVLYELLTGCSRFDCPSGSLRRFLPGLLTERRGATPPFRHRNPAVAPALEAIVLKCLQADPAGRYTTARALAEDLERQRLNLPLRHAREPSFRERFRKWRRRNPRLVSAPSGIALAAAAALLVTAGGVYASLEGRRAELGRQFALGREKVGAFDRGASTTRQYLASPNGFSGWIETGLKAGLETLDTVGALDNPNWLDRPEFAHLATADRERLKGSAEEVAYLISLARRAHPEEASRLAESGLPGKFRSIPLPEIRGPFLEAVDLQSNGKYRESLAILSRLNGSEPNVAEYHFLAGQARRMLGENEEAYLEFTTGIALKPNFAPGYAQRGAVKYALGRYREALSDYEAAVRLEPGAVDLLLKLAGCRAQQLDYAGAVAILTSLAARQETPPRVWFLMAEVEKRRGDSRAALRDRERGFAAKCVDSADLVARGLALVGVDPLAALADFAAAERRSPYDVAPLLNQAHVYAKILGKPREAIDALDRLLVHHPQHLDGLCSRAIYLARSGQVEIAQGEAKRMVEISSLPFTHYRAACVYALSSPSDPTAAAKALKYLALSLERGYGLDFVLTDVDLDPLRGNPAFRDLVDYAKKLRKLKDG